MKKRSLFAAVAMLIVSAIVLTSSTYAWFSSQAKASVAQVTAGITDGDVGNVQVKTGSTAWKSSLTNQELGGNFTGMQPVDYNPKDTTPAQKTLTYDGMYFTNVTSVSGENSLVKSYQWKVKAMQNANNKKIKIPVTFGYNSFSNATDTPCLCGAIVVDSTTKYLYATVPTGADYAYKTLGSVTAATEGGTANGIIDGNDTITGSLPENGVSPDNTATIYITSDIATEHTIDVYLWVEGQHPACHGTVNIAGGFTFQNIELVDA